MRRTRTYFGVLFIVFLAFVAAQPAASDAIRHTVGGQILDQQGKPIPGAAIILSGQTTVTTFSSKDGSFQTLAPSGKYHLSVRLGGFTIRAIFMRIYLLIL